MDEKFSILLVRPVYPFDQHRASILKGSSAKSLGVHRAFKVDWLKTIRPIFQGGAIRLRRLLLGKHSGLFGIGGMELKPAYPCSIGSFFTADPDNVSGMPSDQLRGVRAD